MSVGGDRGQLARPEVAPEDRRRLEYGARRWRKPAEVLVEGRLHPVGGEPALTARARSKNLAHEQRVALGDPKHLLGVGSPALAARNPDRDIIPGEARH